MFFDEHIVHRLQTLSSFLLTEIVFKDDYLWLVGSLCKPRKNRVVTFLLISWKNKIT